MSSEDDVRNLTIYGASGLLKFIKKNNIMMFVIAALLSSYFNELTSAVNNYILYPIIGKFIHPKKLEAKVTTIFGIKIEYGKLSLVLIKVLSMFFIIYLVYLISTQML